MKDQNFIKMIPVLPSADVGRDIKYWNNLGFKCVYDSTDYSEGTVDYAVLVREEIELHLQFQYPSDMEFHCSQIKIQVKDVMPIYEEYIKAGVAESIHKNTPWGTHEFGFYDLNKVAVFMVEYLPS